MAGKSALGSGFRDITKNGMLFKNFKYDLDEPQSYEDFNSEEIIRMMENHVITSILSGNLTIRSYQSFEDDSIKLVLGRKNE